jgi:hypothetical protein
MDPMSYAGQAGTMPKHSRKRAGITQAEQIPVCMPNNRVPGAWQVQVMWNSASICFEGYQGAGADFHRQAAHTTIRHNQLPRAQRKASPVRYAKHPYPSRCLMPGPTLRILTGTIICEAHKLFPAFSIQAQCSQDKGATAGWCAGQVHMLKACILTRPIVGLAVRSATQLQEGTA